MDENLIVHSAQEEEQTFSDVKKGSKNFEYVTKNASVVTIPMRVNGEDQLIPHPLSQSIYRAIDHDKVKRLADNIKGRGLIYMIIINQKNQILSGYLRYLALQLLNVEYIDVYVIDIDAEDELEFIIYSNQQREKTILDACYEIITLYDKYSPGQGSRASKGENTIKKIAEITGYSTNFISSVRKINSTFHDLFNEIMEGNLTLNAALKMCDVVEKLERLSEVVGKNLLEDLPAEKIEQTFKSQVRSYCKESNPECYAMLSNNQMTEKEAYNKMFPKKDKAEKKDEPKETLLGSDLSNDTLYCPCCSQKVKKDSKDTEWIKKWKDNILEYVKNLKFPVDENL